MGVGFYAPIAFLCTHITCRANCPACISNSTAWNKLSFYVNEGGVKWKRTLGECSNRLCVAYSAQGENCKGEWKITHLEEAFGNIDLKVAKGIYIRGKKHNEHRVRLRWEIAAYLCCERDRLMWYSTLVVGLCSEDAKQTDHLDITECAFANLYQWREDSGQDWKWGSHLTAAAE